MKSLFTVLFFTSFNLIASECEIELYSKVYRLIDNQILQARDLVKNTTCSPDITNKLSSLISSSQGTVGTDFLRNELQKDFPNLEINFVNKKLSLLSLTNSLKDQLLPDSNLFFFQTRSLNGISSLGLSEGEHLRPICDACTSFGEKNIKIDITNVVENTNRTLWFTTKIMAKVKVVKTKRSISFQEKSLDPQDFYIDEIMTLSPDNALTTLDNIRFYKSNKNILQNAVVSNMDIQAVNLINFGTPVSVTLVSSSISLQKTAMPIRSARFGEMIELKGPNNKNIAGKVVDYNKVVIEL